MKTQKCEKCGLKFKSNSKRTEESRRHWRCFTTCPRCKAEITWIEDKQKDERCT